MLEVSIPKEPRRRLVRPSLVLNVHNDLTSFAVLPEYIPLVFAYNRSASLRMAISTVEYEVSRTT